MTPRRHGKLEIIDVAIPVTNVNQVQAVERWKASIAYTRCGSAESASTRITNVC